MLLSQLEYFQVVARHQHISRAAEELRIAQPSLSMTIGKLEKELGVQLFDRQGRNIVLNHAGQRLLDHTNFILEQIGKMEHALKQTREATENAFIMSVSNSMFLNGWLQQFVLANPKIQLQQRMLSEAQMIEALLEESVDIAIGEFAYDTPGIIRQTIVEDEYIIMVPVFHPLAEKDSLLFEDIVNEPLLSLPSNTIHRIANTIFAQKDCEPNIIFEGHQRMLGKMLRIGRGLLFGSRQMIYMKSGWVQPFRREEDCYEIMVLPIRDVDCHCKLSICWKEGRQLPLMAKRFIEAIETKYPKYTENLEFLSSKRVRTSI